MSAGAWPQTPLGELTAPPDSLAGFKGAALLQEGMEGRTRGAEGRGMGEWGRDGRRGSCNGG